MHDQTDADMMQNKAGSTFTAFECDLFQDSKGKVGHRSHMAFLKRKEKKNLKCFQSQFDKSYSCVTSSTARLLLHNASRILVVKAADLIN